MAFSVIDQQEVSYSGMGNLACSDGKQFQNGNLSFTGFRNNPGQLYGSFEIYFKDAYNSTLSQGGVLDRGDIDPKGFSIGGLVMSDTLCNSTAPKPITINGDCEKVSVATMKIQEDQTGSFTGKVVCPKERGPDAPVAEASGPSEVIGGQEVVLDASNSYDPDRDELTFSWRQIGGPEVESFGTDGQRSTIITPAVEKTSILDFEIMVTDVNGITDVDTFSMVLLPEESSPVAEASGPSEVIGGQEVVLDASNSYDPDRDELTFSWRQIGGPEVELSYPDQKTARFEAPVMKQNFSLMFKVTVTDVKGEHDEDGVQVFVRNFIKPLINATAGNDTVPTIPPVDIPVANDTTGDITRPIDQPPDDQPPDDQPPDDQPPDDQPPDDQPPDDQPPDDQPPDDQPPDDQPPDDQPPDDDDIGSIGEE